MSADIDILNEDFFCWRNSNRREIQNSLNFSFKKVFDHSFSWIIGDSDYSDSDFIIFDILNYFILMKNRNTIVICANNFWFDIEDWNEFKALVEKARI